jgi:hypothetical protein
VVISGRKVGGTPSEAIRKAIDAIVISIAGKRGGARETRNTAGCIGGRKVPESGLANNGAVYEVEKMMAS